MNLIKRGIALNNSRNLVVRVSRAEIQDQQLREKTALFFDDVGSFNQGDFHGYPMLITPSKVEDPEILSRYPIIHSVKDIESLSEGDVISLHANSNHFRVLYRVNSKHNTIFTTEACNSNCLMCSQPPKEVAPDLLVEEIMQLLDLIHPITESLGITGGEPLLLGDHLFKIIDTCKQLYPHMNLHMLTNGRLFQDDTIAKKYAAIGHPSLMAGIPLYSDVDSIHNYVVQAENAFSETIAGIHNLGRYKQRVEIRVVLHKQTYERLPQLAKFIYRNMPFVNHIAFMGLEVVGYVKANFNDLWIDPYDYQKQLYEAVQFLAKNDMNVSIYNHQLCTLDKRLWKFAKASISDWKNTYDDECEKCDVLGICGGFFQWNPSVRSSHIKAISYL